MTRELVDVFVPVVTEAAARDRARRFLADRVISARDFPDIAFDNGGCWTADVSRAHARHLHGFIFLADWHLTVLNRDVTDDVVVRRAASRGVDLLLRWQDVVAARDDLPMAHHDETTAQRLMQLCRLLDDHGDVIEDARRDQVATLATSTAELLVTDDFYAGINNHGMFQDLSLLRFAASSETWLPRTELADRATRCAAERLSDYFSVAFTRDGVHVENSPAYHLMVARSLRDVIPAVRAVDPDQAVVLERIYEGAERFAVHSVLPDGTIAPLGDTKVLTVGRSGHRSTFTGPAYRYVTRNGQEGEPPAERSVVFAHGGYAMHRTAWGDPDAYVMTFKAAYLAHYHHHCDDLALTVFGRGRWLLSEAGPNGYDYKNPLTKYAYSQHAHNVVVVDGRSLPRVDQEPGGVHLVDRLAEPLSNPPGAARTGLRALLRRRVGRAATAPDSQLAPVKDHLMHVTGTNSRFAAAVHARDVRVREPGGNLHILVTDTVEHQDGQEHDYEVLWHIGPGVEVTLHDTGAELAVGGSTVLDLSWFGPGTPRANIIRPRDTGRVQAMRFPRFGRHEPSTVIRVASRGRGLRLTTTIRAGDSPGLT
nr:heparinase II/III family protein [Ornithinimicrobium sp. HY1793]